MFRKIDMITQKKKELLSLLRQYKTELKETSRRKITNYGKTTNTVEYSIQKINKKDYNIVVKKHTGDGLDKFVQGVDAFIDGNEDIWLLWNDYMPGFQVSLKRPLSNFQKQFDIFIKNYFSK